MPKFLVNPDGSLGKRNDVYCASIEHKLGIKASPTAVLVYGDDKGEVGPGAIGYLVGQENRGLEYMFIMMNAARFAVGVQGIAVSERAYQKAVQYAKERIQSRPVDGSANKAVPIIHHPDVRRMLMTMRATTEGAAPWRSWPRPRMTAAHHHPDEQVRKQNQAFYEFMVPLVKGYSTEMSLEVTSLGVQVHGGMGFIEETGAAQYYRDAKISRSTKARPPSRPTIWWVARPHVTAGRRPGRSPRRSRRPRPSWRAATARPRAPCSRA
ncbi:acyl-CoA dehydrogenase family protein [Schlegelella aquatica]|uniref:acyl-CoA dehydrogenase family protein n=1 Tax=Caldimonas aquatica TaxID=376175 RepID=UPI0037536DC9